MRRSHRSRHPTSHGHEYQLPCLRYVQQQIEKAKAEAGSDEEFEATELLKDENEVLKLDLKLKPTMLASKATDSKVGVKSVFKEAAAVKKESDKIKQNIYSRKICTNLHLFSKIAKLQNKLI